MQIFTRELMSLGLSELEAKVYLTLIKKNFFSATELAASVRIHRTQIYDVLANLIKKGMCIEVLGSIKKYEAVSPLKIMKDITKNLEQQKLMAEGLSIELTKIFDRNHDNRDPLDFVKVLRTPATIREHVFGLIRAAEKEVRVFNKPPYSMNPEKNEPEVDSLKKGIVHKCVYEIEKENRDFLNRVRNFVAQGEQVRLNEKLPLKLVIFDLKCVVMTLYNIGELNSQFTAMSIEHSEFAQAMADIFELYWSNSLNLDDYQVPKIKE